MAWAFEQAMGLVWYYEVSNSLVSLWGRRTHAGSLTLGDQVVHLTRLLHREPFQMVTAIQQPGHCLWRVRKPLSPQAPDE